MITGNPKPASFSKRIRESLCAMIFLAILLPASPVMAQWQQVSSGITSNLVAGSFANDSTGYLVSADGKVLKTTDTGANWTLCGSLTGTFTSIFCTGPDTVYTGGNQLYRSPDQGATWEFVTTFLPATITDLCFFGSKHGFMILPGWTNCYENGVYYLQDSYHLKKSDDYGESWQYLSENLAAYSRFDVLSDSVAFVSGGLFWNLSGCNTWYMGSSKRTTDRGQTWQGTNLPAIENISFFHPDTGYFVAYYPPVLKKTVDGGATFTDQMVFTPEGGTSRDFLFMNQIDAYIKGTNNIYVSASEGVAWQVDHSSTRTLNRLIRNGGHTIFCIGDSGTILKKLVVPSPYPDTIYNYAAPNIPINFGMIDLGSTNIKQFFIENRGNTPISLNLSSTDAFGISLSHSNFVDTLPVTVGLFAKTTIYIRFAPQHEGTYNGLITIKHNQLSDGYINVIGECDAVLSGEVVKDTLVCKKTLRIKSGLTVKPGVTLTICEGTTVNFLGSQNGMIVQGVLSALGDSASPIIFNEPLWSSDRHTIFFQHADPSDTSVLQYCKIYSDEPAGPAIYLLNSIARMDHCIIETMKSTRISLEGPNSGLDLRNSEIFNTFPGALTYNCGSIFAKNPGWCRISNSSFHGYNSDISIYSTGNPAAINFSTRMENCTFFNTDGSVTIYGDAIVTGNRFYNNLDGINLSFAKDTLLFSGNEIFDNRTDHNTSTVKIVNLYTSAYVTQNLIYNNTSWDHGAGIRILADPQDTDTVYIIGNTICNNHTENGLGSDLYATGRCVFRNNIIWNLRDTLNSVYVHDLANSVVDHNCFSQPLNTGVDNILANPSFTNPTGYIGYNYTGPVTADWTLLQQSPCINAGNPGPFPYIPATDFAGNPRVVHGRIDMGAYEYNSSLSVAGISQEQPCLVFPNPATGYLTVSATGQRSGELVITDCSGRTLIRSAFHGSARVSITDLPPGIYICTVSEPDGVICRGKFVRQ